MYLRQALQGILHPRVETKLRAILVAFSLSILLLLYLLAAEKNIAIQFAAKELQGNTYLRVTRALMASAQSQRLAMLGSGDPRQASALAVPATRDLQRLQAMDARLGGLLATGDRVQKLQTRWQTLQTTYTRQETAAQTVAYRAFMSDLGDLISWVGDKSNLILDPDLDSYYAMDATLLKLPEEENVLADTIVLSHAITTAHRLTPDQRTALTVNLTLLRANADGLNHDMEVAFRENPLHNMRARLDVPLEIKKQSAQAFVNLLEQRLVRAPRIDLASDDVRIRGTQALADSYDAWDKATEQLDVLLQARIAGFEQRKRQAFGGAALVLVPTLLMSLLLSRYIARMLNEVSQRLERLQRGEITQLEQGIAALAAGDLSAEIVTHTTEEPLLSVRTKDELGVLAQSLNNLAQQTLSTVMSFRHTQRALADARTAARDSEARFRSVVEGLGEGILVTDFDDIVLYANSPLAELTGYSVEEMVGQPAFARLLTPEDQQKVCRCSEHLEQGPQERYEVQMRRKDATLFWAEMHTMPFKDADGVITGVLGAVTDISKRKRFEAQLSHQAFHDSLSGLPNRALFMDRLQRALKRTRRSETCVGVLFLDLDNFKIINDSLGHDAGDALLLAIARRLSDCIGPNDTVARLGGDEFTILLEEITDVADATVIAERIVASLHAPIRLQKQEVFPSASIGVVCSDTDTVSADALLRDADTAMYQVKANGRSGFAIFNKDMNDRVVERMELENGLRRALAQGEFCVYYQPLIALNTGQLTGMEALLRWNHPTRGQIPPIQFIPIAEETNLILPIGYWVLEEACRQTCAWQKQHPEWEALAVSVNMSGKQLQQPDVVERVAEVLQKTGLSPGSLKLEITESVLMQDMDDIIAKLHRLKALGLKLAVDDFGTGYSSMSSLSAFPVDTLKIDRSFISRLGSHEEANAVINAIIMLSKALQLDITGEGLETEEQVVHLQGMGCQTGQGYYFARPVAGEEMEKYLVSGENTFLKPHQETMTAYIEQMLNQSRQDWQEAA